MNDWFPPVVDGSFGGRGQEICRGLLERGDGNGS